MKKVKKFGRGGDILTGLGAGLAAFGAYKHFFGDKDKEQTSTGRDVSEPAPQDRGRKGEDLIRKAVEDKKDTENKNTEAKSEDKTEVKELSKRGKFPYEAGDGTSGAGLGDKPSTAANSSSNRRAAPAKKVSAKKAPAKDRNAEFANLYQGLTTAPKEAAPTAAADTRLKPADVSGVGSNVLSNVAGRRREAAKREQAAKDRLAKFEEKRRESKERETRRTQTQNKAKSGTSLRAPGSSMNLNDPYAMMLGSEFDPKRVVRENKSRLPGDKLEYKKGGKVKKYASGGSVKRSASSRADGIAIRGKTRA